MHIHGHPVTFCSTDCGSDDDKGILRDKIPDASLVFLAVARVGLDVELQAETNWKEGDEKKNGREGKARA